MHDAPQLRLGLVTDLHYDGSAVRMNRLYSAITSLNRGNADALVLMGDLIDGHSEFSARRLLKEVAALCGSFSGPLYYMPGNHDLDHLSKEGFFRGLGYAGNPAGFHFPMAGYDVVCIDGCFSPDGREYDRGNFEWQEACVPHEQLIWLKDYLSGCSKPVIAISHQRVDLGCTHAVQNHEAVRDVLRASGRVRAVFQGHQHADDLRVIDDIPYYTLSAFRDGAGPAMVQIDDSEIWLDRDFMIVDEEKSV